MIRIAVIGYGYWGPNIVRNFSRIPSVTISWIVDVNPKTLTEIPLLYPTIKTTQKVNDVISDPKVDAVVIVTPPSTHFSLAKLALTAGKHVLVEKPMTQTVSEGKKLVAIAKKKKLILMVDHTFIYTPAIGKLKTIINSGELGTITSIDCVRTNLGILQKDSNVVSDLAVHDFSILDYLFQKSPQSIQATGVLQKELGQETVAYMTASFSKQLFVHLHVSWLSPVKIRRMTFVGTKKMLIYDDVEATEKLKIYDKGVSFTKDPNRAYQLRVGYRSGMVTIPHLEIEEGLYGMAKEFIRAIITKKQPITDGLMGLRVVQCLQGATKSLRSNGKSIRI